jgi:hypothetical protein
MLCYIMQLYNPTNINVALSTAWRNNEMVDV